MFTAIKTTKNNKEIVTQLTKRLNLGAENTIARLALSYSLANDRKLELSEIGDAQGKEYSSKVLFGDYSDIYLAMVCVHYNIYKTDKDIAKYIKMHIDDGLRLIDQEIHKSDSITGIEFIINKISRGLKHLG